MKTKTNCLITALCAAAVAGFAGASAKVYGEDAQSFGAKNVTIYIYEKARTASENTQFEKSRQSGSESRLLEENETELQLFGDELLAGGRSIRSADTRGVVDFSYDMSLREYRRMYTPFQDYEIPGGNRMATLADVDGNVELVEWKRGENNEWKPLVRVHGDIPWSIVHTFDQPSAIDRYGYASKIVLRMEPRDFLKLFPDGEDIEIAASDKTLHVWPDPGVMELSQLESPVQDR